MKRKAPTGFVYVAIAFLAAFSTTSCKDRRDTDHQPFGLDHRVPWTTSRLVGSPDPPLPYTVERIFTRIKWERPIFIAAEPGTDRLLVVQQGGETNQPSRILQLRNDPNAKDISPFLTVSRRLIYSLTFHPGYRTNGYIYIFSNGPTPESNRVNRISRYNVARQAPYQCDPKSELPIIEWRSMGHDGGGLVFGHDDMLYISSGDGSTDSDDWVTGQDLSELNGGILRIDVDHPDSSRPYSVPKDNPFVGLKDARAENWAYGLRNPWRLTMDEKSGRIWVGNNGQDLWETAHLVRRGENYGWSVYEGSHPFYLNRKLGPTPVVLPTIEHSHSEARSLTGGVVYYGNDLPELEGLYLYGDYSTGKIWATGHDGERVTSQQEIANTELQITAFAVDQHHQLLITDHLGGIYRLVRAQKQSATTDFPKRLSETGLFLSTKDHQLQPGVIPYSVNAPAWQDGASAERFIALPNELTFDHNPSTSWNATNGAVLVQTVSLECQAGDPTSRRRIETRILLKQTGQWTGYSYRWDETQSDATLVAAKGEDQEITITNTTAPGGARKLSWRYPSRSECSACHSRAANFVLGLTDAQLDRVQNYGTVNDNQLRTLRHIGLIKNASKSESSGKPARLADPYDSNEALETRARAYLQVNCSVCHVGAGGGNSKMQLGLSTKREEMNLIGARPQHDTFGIDNAMLVAPGDPDRSILYQRLSRRGRGQMPPVVISTVDRQALALFRDWIRGMKPEHPFVRDWTMEDLLPRLDQLNASRSAASGKAAFNQAGCPQCHRFGAEGGSVGPDLKGVGKRLSLHDLLESIILPSKVIVEGYATTEIETQTGEVTTGRVVHEDDQAVVVLPQSATAEVVTIRKTDIRRRELSKVSNMPTGILNTLNESQILDLLSYLLSDGGERPGK